MISSIKLIFFPSILFVFSILTFCQSIDNNLNKNEMDIRYILSRFRRQTDLIDGDSMPSMSKVTNDSAKSANISWDEINETFDRYLPEAEVQQKWNLMEHNLKSGNPSLFSR